VQRLGDRERVYDVADRGELDEREFIETARRSG